MNKMQTYEFWIILTMIWSSIAGCIAFKNAMGVTRLKALQSMILIVVGGVLGARLLHVVLHWKFYRESTNRIWGASFFGFTIIGGLIGASIVAFVICILFKKSPLKLADELVPILGISVMLSRVGCYFNGCCFGKITEVPWAIAFPVGTSAYNYSVSMRIKKESGIFDWFFLPKLHPTMLYEFIGVSFLLWFILKSKRLKSISGGRMFFFIGGYACIRLLNHGFRVAPMTYSASPMLLPILYLSIIFASIVFLNHLKR